MADVTTLALVALMLRRGRFYCHQLMLLEDFGTCFGGGGSDSGKDYCNYAAACSSGGATRIDGFTESRGKLGDLQVVARERQAIKLVL